MRLFFLAFFFGVQVARLGFIYVLKDPVLCSVSKRFY
jgi:hypothetical protein